MENQPPGDTIADVEEEDSVHEKPSLVAVDHMPTNPDSEETPSYFLSYFFALTIICIAGYLILHNKNKVTKYFRNSIIDHKSCIPTRLFAAFRPLSHISQVRRDKEASSGV